MVEMHEYGSESLLPDDARARYEPEATEAADSGQLTGWEAELKGIAKAIHADVGYSELVEERLVYAVFNNVPGKSPKGVPYTVDDVSVFVDTKNKKLITRYHVFDGTPEFFLNIKAGYTPDYDDAEYDRLIAKHTKKGRKLDDYRKAGE